jgi:hypothetical protein
VRGLTLEGQSRLVLNSRLIEWLIRTVRPEGADRLLSINNLMKVELQRRLPEAPGQGGPRERFEVPDELSRRLQDAGLAEAPAAEGLPAVATTPCDTDYCKLCRSNGVPVPPDWGPSHVGPDQGQWQSKGRLTVDFLKSDDNPVAEVFTYASPEGMCIALPRSNPDHS